MDLSDEISRAVLWGLVATNVGGFALTCLEVLFSNHSSIFKLVGVSILFLLLLIVTTGAVYAVKKMTGARAR
jgi:predicted RND superfamily exporter protein